jgi:type I restriction enzyme S subunit
MALIPDELDGVVVSNEFPLFEIDRSQLDPAYLNRMVQADLFLAELERISAGASGQNRVKESSFLGLRVSLPSLPEQRRIAAILDRADAVRAKRREVLAHLDSLARAIFHDMFGGLSHTDAPLGELAAVTSGITKGRRTEEPTTPTPYLAVANVQAGWLDLGAVKSIDATDAERERYALRSGDVVLTEGGDPDKLGRGTVWRDELPLCLHQNHIFRVRSDQSRVLPDYLAAFIASSRARSYFLRSAKQTTGIASINMTQLRALPVPVPPLKLQRLFIARTAAATDARARIESALTADDELFTSLQSRAFRGEL